MNFMRLTLIMMLSLALAGCQTAPVYNPMTASLQQEILLNESGLKAVQVGMSAEEVHKIMGQELLVGYAYQSPDYHPTVIPNPYKSEVIKGTPYLIEYYVESIRQPDGVVGNDELMPLVFKDNKLIGRGWPLANSLHKA